MITQQPVIVSKRRATWTALITANSTGGQRRAWPCVKRVLMIFIYYPQSNPHQSQIWNNSKDKEDYGSSTNTL